MDESQTEVRSGIKLHEVLGIARRRIWWLIVPMLLGPTAGYLVSRTIPPVYTSQAFILVEQQKVPDTFVPSMVTDQLETRLLTLQDQILSRSKLQPIVEEFGLYGDRQSGSMDERVNRLRRDIKITTIRPDSSSALRGFYVSVNAAQGSTAQQICTRVLSMFMEENLKTRSERAENTTDFLSGQLSEAKHKLDSTDAELAAFKMRYMGRLPTDEQSNLQMLATLSSRLDAVNEAIVTTQQQRASQATLLTQEISAARLSTPAGGKSDLERQLGDLRTQLLTLQTRYTASHPEVIKLREQIESLQQQLQRLSTVPPTQTPSVQTAEPATPQIAQLQASLQALDETIRLKRAEQSRLGQQIAAIQEHLQLSPMVEEQFKQLTRDYEGALQFYNDLLAKKRQSEMVADLERQREGEQFRVMDAPDLPTRKSSPNPVKFAAGGLFAGFLLGAGMAAFLDLRNRLIRTEQDVTQDLNLPVVAVLPDLDSNPRVVTAHREGAA